MCASRSGGFYTDVEYRYPWAGSSDQPADRPASEDWVSVLIPDNVQAPVSAISVVCDDGPVCERFLPDSTQIRLNSAATINASVPPGVYSLSELVAAATVDDTDARLAVYQGRLSVRCVDTAGSSISIGPPGISTPAAHAAWFGWIPRADPGSVNVEPGSAVFLDDLSEVPKDVISRAEQGVDHLTEPITGGSTSEDPEAKQYTVKRLISVGRSTATVNSVGGTNDVRDSTALWADHFGTTVGKLPSTTENLANRTAQISGGTAIWQNFDDTTTSGRNNVYRRMTLIDPIGSSFMNVGWRSEGASWVHPTIHGRVDGVVRWEGPYKELERPISMAGKFVNLVWTTQDGSPIYERGARACSIRLHH